MCGRSGSFYPLLSQSIADARLSVFFWSSEVRDGAAAFSSAFCYSGVCSTRSGSCFMFADSAKNIDDHVGNLVRPRGSTGTLYRKMPRTAKPFWVLRPVCINKYAFGFRRTMEHLRAWPVVLPECVKKVEVSLSRRKERDSLSPHHGTRYVLVHVKNQTLPKHRLLSTKVARHTFET